MTAEEERATRDTGAKAATLIREARVRMNLNMFVWILYGLTTGKNDFNCDRTDAVEMPRFTPKLDFFIIEKIEIRPELQTKNNIPTILIQLTPKKCLEIRLLIATYQTCFESFIKRWNYLHMKPFNNQLHFASVDEDKFFETTLLLVAIEEMWITTNHSRLRHRINSDLIE